LRGLTASAEKNMWTKYVPVEIWILVGLCLLLLATLNSTRGDFNKTSQSSFIMQSIVFFVNAFVTVLRILFRYCHRWKLLAVFELLFSSLIYLYENSITLGVVVRSVPTPYTSTSELYSNNYTFAVQQYAFGRVYDWLPDEYNTVNHPRVIRVGHSWHLGEWLESYFLKPENERKYAIVGYLSKHFHYRALIFVKDKNDTCYQMNPSNEDLVFSPEGFYFTFASSLAHALYKGVSRLQYGGFVSAFENSQQFSEHLVALDYAKPLVAKYYDKGITYEDLKNNRLKENIITLGNIKSVVYIGLMLILFACVCFIAEVCSKEIVFMMLT